MSIIKTLLENIRSARTFNQMLAVEFKRVVLEREITRAQFEKMVNEYMMTKPRVTRSMMREKLMQRLTGDSMTVKGFRAGLRVIGVDDYQAVLEINIKAEGLSYPKTTTAIKGFYQISDDAR